MSQCVFQALSLIGDRRNKEAAERLEKEKELQKVAVKKDDIELIVSCNFLRNPPKIRNKETCRITKVNDLKQASLQNQQPLGANRLQCKTFMRVFKGGGISPAVDDDDEIGSQDTTSIQYHGRYPQNA